MASDSAPNRASHADEPKRTAARSLLKAVKWISALIILPIFVALMAAGLFINSARGHAFLLNLLQSQASNALGVGVHLQNFAVHLSNLSVDLYGITVDGASPYAAPPLLQVQHAEAGIRVVSLLQRKWYFDSIRVDQPVVQVFVDADGISNLPVFKQSSTGSNTSVFDLGIRHAVLANGTLLYNNRPLPLTLDLRNVEFDSSFDATLQKYSGTLAYSDGRIDYAGKQPPPHSLSVKFDATPNTLHLSPARIESGKTQLSLVATLNDYTSPHVQAEYNAIVDGQQIAAILRNPSIPAGLVSVSGSARYQFNPDRTLLQSLVADGNFSSPRLIAKTQSVRTEVTGISGHYSLADSSATVRGFRAHLLGGYITGEGTMKNIAGDSRTNIAATLRGISLADAQRTFATVLATGPVAVSGTLDASASASWGRTLADLVAQADATINAGIQNAAPGRATVEQTETPQPASAPAVSNFIPIEGDIHGTYSARNQLIKLSDSYLHTSQTKLSFSGAISNNSSLAFQLQANDLREVETIADLFRASAPGEAVQQLGLTGTASFDGVIRGSIASPHLTGELSAHNLQIQGSSWKLLRTSIDADSSHVSLQHAELEPAAQGRVTMNAAAQLRDWSFSGSNPIVIQLNAAQLDVSELAALAGKQVPVTGTVSANIAMHGSLLNPVGNGEVTLTKAAAYGEPIHSMKLTFNGTGDQARGSLAISAPAGSIDARFAIRPQEKSYSVQLTSPGIHIERLEHLKSTNLKASGVVAIDARGQGTFDNPQLDATVQIPTLVIQQQTLSDIRLQANIANHVATAQLTSSAVNTSIKANARIALTGDFPVDATLDTQSIPLGPILAAYAPDEASNLNGQTELHATLHGPLRNTRQLEAHATVPVFKLSYGNSIQLAQTAPIHADYQNGVITIQRSSIRGTDTDLQFQGSIPTSGNGAMSLLLLGSVDLHLAQLFDPDLRTSGQIKFNVNSYGASHDPGIAGTIDVVDASVASVDLPLGLQHANGTLTVKSNRIDIATFKGSVGGGTLTAQGGVALTPSIQFDLGVAAQDIRMLYPQGMRENIDANLRLTGSTKSAVVGGTVSVTDLSFTRAFDLTALINQFTGGVAAPPSQGFARDVALNLAVHSTNSVNLVSPTLSVGGSANLQVRGTAAEPVILGRVNLTGGDILLSGNRYVLTGGTIQFVNPSVTQPVVNLNLTTTIQQYNISLRFEGPVEQMRTQYTSDPSLPQADIIHLLAFGQTTEAASASATPANQAAQSIVANQVSSQITSRISKIAGISQLSINPVLSNGNSQGFSGANITIQQRVTGNLFVTFSGNLATNQGQTIQGQYQVTPHVAVSATSDTTGGFAVDVLIKKSW